MEKMGALPPILGAPILGEDGRWSEALSYGEELVELLLDEDGPRRFVEQVRAEMARNPG